MDVKGLYGYGYTIQSSIASIPCSLALATPAIMALTCAGGCPSK